MPKLGLTMEEGLVSEWKVAPGDRVNVGDIIFVVETDKIASDIESVDAGVVETLYAKAGDVVPVGGIVATLAGEDAGDGPAKSASVASPALEVASASAPSSQSRVRPIATPQARRLARSAKILLTSIQGSGPRGRIIADDVRSRMPKPSVIDARPSPAPAASVSVAPGEERGKLTVMGQHQKIVARRLSESKRDIPHFYVFAEADVTSLSLLRAGINDGADPIKVSVNHFVITAVARAIAAMPSINVVWSNDGLIQYDTVDIGVAVEAPKGLVAPVLRDLGSNSLDQIAEKASVLVARARGGRLSQEDFQGGVTSVSNVGMFGATALIPIINPGQSSILGVGRAQDVFRPDEQKQPRLRQVLTLALSCDHRVIDGALAARFLSRIQKGLEEPFSLLRQTSRVPNQ